jgi:hypothetical protein
MENRKKKTTGEAVSNIAGCFTLHNVDINPCSGYLIIQNKYEFTLNKEL